MNGVHDMGGMHGLGQLEREAREPVFSYYEHWCYAYTVMMIETGMATPDELRTGRPAKGPERRDDAATADSVGPALSRGHDARREIADPPRFAVGQQVRTRNIHPAGHTRLPRYARGKLGAVHAHHGAHVLPDTNAHGKGECPEHVYSVAIAARELWGPQAAPKDKVYLDLWESYLEPA
jgi:nitrile hydratase